MTATKYRMRCTTEGIDVCVIASAVPTLCPTNAGHSVVAASIMAADSNVLVNDGTATDLTLADYKQLRYNEIDGKTLALISAGFVYDSKTFSLSASAQLNWSGLKGETAEFTWPVEISTKDNYAYSLTEANLTAFWTAGRDEIQGNLDSGRALKKSVYDAANEAAVDAVTDTR